MLISKFAGKNLTEQITALETEYHITLPSQYRDFLSKYNGGDTPKTKCKAGRISSDVRGFYGVGDVKLSFHSMELKQWIDKSFFPIAGDSFGNYYVIGLDAEHYGKLFFCDHEQENKMEYVAENLKEFLRHCKSEKISEASKRSIKEREEELIAKGRGDIITDGLRQMWQAEIDKYANMVQEEVYISGE